MQNRSHITITHNISLCCIYFSNWNCCHPQYVGRAAEWTAKFNRPKYCRQCKKQAVNHFLMKKSQCPTSHTADEAFKWLWLAHTYRRGLRSARPRSQLPCFTIKNNFFAACKKKNFKWYLQCWGANRHLILRRASITCPDMLQQQQTPLPLFIQSHTVGKQWLTLR